jgi:hypothetical protein
MDRSRLVGAFLFLLLLILAAFGGWAIKWEAAAIAFLHLTEVAAGGLAGLFFGENAAVRTLAIERNR